MRYLLIVAILSGCSGISEMTMSPDMLPAIGADMSKPSSVDLSPTTPQCQWAFTAPITSTGMLTVNNNPVADGAPQCEVYADAFELKTKRADGRIDDIIIANGTVHLYRLIDPGLAIPEITCQTWSGNFTLTASFPTPAAQFDLLCTEPNSGYSYWSPDGGTAPDTRLTGTISIK